jgi:hypothetical protein
MKAFNLISLALLVFISSGCTRSTHESMFEDIKILNEEKQQLGNRVKELEAQNRQLTQQLAHFSEFDISDGNNLLPIVENVTLTNRTGFVDIDNDGTKDNVVVYILPYDRTIDVFKATGFVEVQLWDLEEPDNNALLYQWIIKPLELTQSWEQGFLSCYYKLNFDIDYEIMQAGKQYTLKVSFTDYISGKSFNIQKAIEYN